MDPVDPDPDSDPDPQHWKIYIAGDFTVFERYRQDRLDQRKSGTNG